MHLIENCWNSEAVGHRDTGFVMDGHEHAILVLSKPPQSTNPLIMEAVTQVPIRNYTITLFIEPLDVEKVIRQEEESFRRVEGDVARERRIGDEATLEKKRTKAKTLREGFLRPFNFRLVIHVWAPDRKELTARLLALKQALQAMGAQYYEPNLPSTCRKLFEQAWPGWVGSPYRHFKHYAEDTWLADLWPLRANFGGHPTGSEALYDSLKGGLVSITLEVNHVPQHGVLIARSGHGKSLLGQDLLSQVAGFFGKILIIDSGGSFEALTAVMAPGAKATIVRPNGTLTLNYLDPAGTPLNPEHLEGAAIFASVMAGRSNDEDRRRRNEAVLLAAIQQLYTDCFNDWERAHPDEAFQLAGLACHLAEQCAAQPDLTFTDAYAAWRDGGAQFPQLDERKVVSTLKEPRYREMVRNLAFARFAPSDQPTHSMLVELLRLDFHADPNTARALADVLEAWRRDGAHGPLVDGASNARLDSAWVQLEVGEVSQRDEALRAITMLLAYNQIWKNVFALPRRMRKVVLLEETSALLAMPDAQRPIATAYEQARKMNTVILTVFPAYAPLANSPIRETVMNNSRLFLLGRMDDAPEAERLGRDLSLPASAVSAIQNLPMPTDRASGAPFLYYHRHSPQSVCGVLVNVPSPEMFYVAASHGAHVAARRKQLQGDPATVLDRVIANAKNL